VPLLIGLVVSLAVTPLAMAVARRVGLLDHPGPLKIHADPVPYLGGVGILAAAAAGLASDRPDLIIPLLLAPSLALALGVLDDAFNLSPMGRLGEQVLCGLFVALIVDTRVPEPWDYLLVTAAVVVIMNGMNFLDGLDGLAGGVALVSSLGFAIALGGVGESLAYAVAGGLLGFLVFNRPPARVYLGDGGSYLLGVLLAVLLTLAWRSGEGWTTSISSVLLVLLPVAEVTFAILRRARARTSPLHGDRRHSYDLLVRSGRTPTEAVLICVGIQATLAGVGAAAAEMPRGAALAVTIVTAAVVAVAGIRAGMLTPDPA
jgi:UDP-GlcNAc:undecaprenyl-phosphate/decaprenyl-phosphate GlcNAc-1-phosphate transferase